MTSHRFIAFFEDPQREVRDRIIIVKAPDKKTRAEMQEAIYEAHPEVFFCTYIGLHKVDPTKIQLS